jgi:hypothetical protein
VPISSAQSIKPWGFFSFPGDLMSSTRQGVNSLSHYFSGALSSESFSQSDDSFNQKTRSEIKFSSTERSTFDVNGQLQLAAVGLHLAKKAYHWISGASSSEKNTEEVKEEIISGVRKLRALERLQKKLDKANKLLDRVEGDSSFKWVKPALEDHQYALSELLDKTTVTRNELSELRLDVDHFYKEFESELAIQKSPQEPITHNFDFERQASNLNKFGIFGAVVNSTGAIASGASSQPLITPGIT